MVFQQKDSFCLSAGLWFFLSVLETDRICSFSDIKSLNDKHGDRLHGQVALGHDAGFEGNDVGLLGSLLPIH